MSNNILSLALEQTGVGALPTPHVSVEDPTTILSAAAGTIDNAVLASDISELTEGLLSSLHGANTVPTTTAYESMSSQGGVACPVEGSGFVRSFLPPPSLNAHSTGGNLTDIDLKDLDDLLPNVCAVGQTISFPGSQSSNPTATIDDELSDLVNNTLKGSQHLDSLIQSNAFGIPIASYPLNSVPNATALITSSSSTPMYDVNAVIGQVSEPAQPSLSTTFPGPSSSDRDQEWTRTQTITAAAEVSHQQKQNLMDGPPAKVRKIMPTEFEAESTRSAVEEVCHSIEGPFDSGDRQCSCYWRMDRVEQKVDRVEQKVDMILHYITANSQQPSNGILQAEEEDEFMENGVNLLHVPATDVYKYAEALLSRLFTKEELARSLVFQSEKSSKPGLPQERVSRLFKESKRRQNCCQCPMANGLKPFDMSLEMGYTHALLHDLLGCIHRQYGYEYDMKEMRKKLNQKCRDSGRKKQKQVPEGHVHGSRP